MDAEQADALVSSVKRAIKSRRPYYWWMCLAGEDGAPVLLVGKREAEVKRDGRQIRKKAKDKRMAQGVVAVDPQNKLLLGLAEGNATPKAAQRALRLGVAKDPLLKAVKPFLIKAEIVSMTTLQELSGATPDNGDSEEQLAEARQDAKDAYQDAVERVGKEHPAIKALIKLRQEAKAHYEKDGEIKRAIDAYKALTKAALKIDVAPDSEEPEVEVDLAKVRKLWDDAHASARLTVDQIRQKLLDTKDDELILIAEVAIDAYSDGEDRNIAGAIEVAMAASPSERPAKLMRVEELVSNYREHVLQSSKIAALDDNPFEVRSTIKRTLNTALSEILDMCA